MKSKLIGHSILAAGLVLALGFGGQAQAAEFSGGGFHEGTSAPSGGYNPSTHAPTVRESDRAPSIGNSFDGRTHSPSSVTGVTGVPGGNLQLENSSDILDLPASDYRPTLNDETQAYSNPNLEDRVLDNPNAIDQDGIIDPASSINPNLNRERP